MNTTKDQSSTFQSTALLRLLHLVSPALPIGAFAYSQGLESAVELEWITDAESCENWISHQLTDGIGRLDLPIFKRLYQNWEKKDVDRLHYWAQYLQASRESAELHQEEQQLGRTMTRLLNSLDFQGNFDEFNYSYISLFSFACLEWGIPLEQATHGFLWSWLENQVTAASKIIPLGQTDAQNTRPKNSENSSGNTKNDTTIADTPTSGINTAAITFCVDPTGQIHPFR